MSDEETQQLILHEREIDRNISDRGLIGGEIELEVFEPDRLVITAGGGGESTEANPQLIGIDRGKEEVIDLRDVGDVGRQVGHRQDGQPEGLVDPAGDCYAPRRVGPQVDDQGIPARFGLTIGHLRRVGNHHGGDADGGQGLR